MNITLTFNDLDEMEAAILRLAGSIRKEAPNKPGANVPEQPSVPPMPKPEKVEEAPKTDAALKTEAAPKTDRVALRKTLSALNKATGENTARKLINEMGFSALTDVPEDRLAELKDKAEEVLNA